MEHESVRQGEMIRRHLAECSRRFKPESLLYLGAGVGNGLESAEVSELRDILAVDVNSEYLALLRKRLGALTTLRTMQCCFPEESSETGCFQLAYGPLFFEYVDLDSTLSRICLASHFRRLSGRAIAATIGAGADDRNRCELARGDPGNHVAP
jgi:hypothetical protein